MWVTLEDINKVWRELDDDEVVRAQALIPIVEDSLKQEAFKRNKDLTKLLSENKLELNVLKSVIIDVIARTLMTSTSQEPMTQFSQSALGYTVSGSFLNAGGGLFIKKSELARLGLTRQKMGLIELC